MDWPALWKREKKMLRRIRIFILRLWRKMDQDDILFLAAGISFNVLFCLLPIMLFWVYLLSYWFQWHDVIRMVDRILEAAFPNQPYTRPIRDSIVSILSDIVAHRKSLGALTLGILLIASASLFSCARISLHRVYGTTSDRHFVLSYLVDIVLVFGLTLIVLLTSSLVGVVHTLLRFRDYLPPAFNPFDVLGIVRALPSFSSVPIIFLLCFLLYRYIPVQHPPVRTAWISAAITSLIWEVSSHLFAFYLGSLTSYSKIYGAYAFIPVLMIWVYYSSIIFILGAEAGHTLQIQQNPESKNLFKAAESAFQTEGYES